MNDSELEACLRALRPVAPSSQLDQKVASELTTEAAPAFPRSGVIVRPQNTWFAGFLPRLLRDVTAACLGAAAAFMSLAYLHRVEQPTSTPTAASVAVAVPIPTAPVAVVAPVVAPASAEATTATSDSVEEAPAKSVTAPIVAAVERAWAKAYPAANDEILMASNTVTSPTLNAVANANASTNVATATATAATEVQSNIEITNELADSEDNDQLITTDSGPAREVRYSYRETHAWQDARTGARIVLEVPREDVYLQPVSFQ